jgi:hypothetical protein
MIYVVMLSLFLLRVCVVQLDSMKKKQKVLTARMARDTRRSTTVAVDAVRRSVPPVGMEKWQPGVVGMTATRKVSAHSPKRHPIPRQHIRCCRIFCWSEHESCKSDIAYFGYRTCEHPMLFKTISYKKQTVEATKQKRRKEEKT